MKNYRVGENKEYKVRRFMEIEHALEEIDGYDKKKKLSAYERIDLAIKLQLANSELMDGDYRDEHAHFQVNAILAVRDAMNELNETFGSMGEEFFNMALAAREISIALKAKGVAAE